MRSVLHARARSEKTSLSELVRQALREHYLGDFEKRKTVMQDLVGIRKDREGQSESVEEVRALRSGSRIENLGDR